MSVTAAKGFHAAGIRSGLKESGGLDLALVVSTNGPVPAAATFTTNLAAAAPVQISRAHLGVTGGRAAGVILNSGGANAATGREGIDSARATCKEVGDHLGCSQEEILVCSTGLIGVRLPVERILSSIPALVGGLGSSIGHAQQAAEAILTTDTHAKQVVIPGSGFVMGGMAKGAGMIGPNMATMLAVLTTDAKVDQGTLGEVLRECVGETFNQLIVDGCTSTNDTVVLLSSGLGDPVGRDALSSVCREACRQLARELADDAEGATKVAEVHVTGAASDTDARLVARGISSSLLVKTSLYGADPYWGRIVSEVGASGAVIALETLKLSYGSTLVFSCGEEVKHDPAAVSEYLSNKFVEIHCDLGVGDGTALVLTTDIGHGYIDENMRTS